MTILSGIEKLMNYSKKEKTQFMSEKDLKQIAEKEEQPSIQLVKEEKPEQQELSPGELLQKQIKENFAKEAEDNMQEEQKELSEMTPVEQLRFHLKNLMKKKQLEK